MRGSIACVLRAMGWHAIESEVARLLCALKSMFWVINTLHGKELLYDSQNLTTCEDLYGTSQ